MSLLKNKYSLIVLILLVGALFRFYHLGQADSYTDEAILGFRAVGMIDYNAAYTQTTPWQWFEVVPDWARLSFHDHPPVFFWAQHFSLNLFGENTLGLRFPSALAGIISLLLVFLLTQRLVDRRAAYIATALLAVQSHYVWISRIGLQDSLLLFFMLLTVWLWLLAWQKNKLFIWLLWGLSLGLGIMTKYTILIVIPILITHAIIFKNSFYKNKSFWLGLVVTLLITLPVILYNGFLYIAVGHFDFQISALLGQETPNWIVRLGREKVGDFGQRMSGFFVVFYRANTWFFNVIAGLSWLGILILYIKNRKQELIFLVLIPILLWLWFLIIGATDRFVVMIVPWLIMLIAYGFSYLLKILHYRKVIYSLLVVLIIAEALFTINSFLLKKPVGNANFAYSQLTDTNQNFGFNQLDKYLDDLLADKYPLATGQPEYNFLTELIDKSIADKQAQNFDPWSLIIIYNHNIFSAAKLWTLQRRLIYNGWIIMPDETFVKITDDQLTDYYRQQGIEDFIYIQVLNSEEYPFDPAADNFAVESEASAIILEYLADLNINPELIKNSQGQDAFAIYKF